MSHLPLSIRLIAVGKMRGSKLEAAGREYLQRLGRYLEVEVVEIKTSLGRGKPEAQAIAEESRALQRRWRAEARQVALHTGGRECDSEDLAKLLERWTHSGTRKIDFVLGGAAGMSREIVAAAHMRLSLSKMTFAHELARVILLEQLYRACTILRGEKYHR